MATKSQSIRDGFGEGLLEAVKQNAQIVVLTADLAESTRVEPINKQYPEQFVECGICEQNMLGVAAGLALSGKIPFVNSFAVFNPGRNWDQLRVSVCYQNLNVKIIGHHAGFSASTDGATHQALEDVALTRVLPHLTVLIPCDFYEAKACVKAAVAYSGPVYIRINKSSVENVTKESKAFELGKGEVLVKGKDLSLAVSGCLTATCLEVAKELKKEVDLEVVKFSTLKPFDSKTLLASATKTKRVITVEDHQINGGLGSTVCEVLAENYPVPVMRLGVNDQFGESGSESELLAKHKIDKTGIIEAIRTFVSKHYEI